MSILKIILTILLCVPFAYLAVTLLGRLLDEALKLNSKGKNRR